MNPAWVAALTGVTVAAVGALGWAGRWAWRLLRGTARFLDEWGGQAAHSGLDATPGIAARLTALEKLAAKLVHETQPNDGNSLRDLVFRTATDVAEIKDEQGRLREQIERRGALGEEE